MNKPIIIPNSITFSPFWFPQKGGGEVLLLLKRVYYENLSNEVATPETRYELEDITCNEQQGKYFTYNHESSQGQEADVIKINSDSSKNTLYADVE